MAALTAWSLAGGGCGALQTPGPPALDAVSEPSARDLPGDADAGRGGLPERPSPGDAQTHDASQGDGAPALPDDGRSDGASADEGSDGVLTDSAPDSATDLGPLDAAAPDGGPFDAGDCPPGSPCELPYTGLCDTGVCDEAGACARQKIPGCCVDDGDCVKEGAAAALGPCQVARCVSYQCQVVTAPGCCADGGACDDGVVCTAEACSVTTHRCAWCPTGCACEPGGGAVWSEDFGAPDLGAEGFIFVDYEPADSVGWQVDGKRWRSPPSSLYLGDPLCHTYDTGPLDADCQPQGGGGPVRAVLYTPLIAVPARGAVAVLWVWADVEPLTGPGAAPSAEPDTLRIFVEEVGGDGLSWARASTLDVGKSTAGRWAPLVVELGPWRGDVVRLRLEFDTFDGLANHHEGIYLDDLTILDRCAATCCTNDSECAALASGAPCQVGRCVGAAGDTPGVCVVAPLTPGEPCVPCAPGAPCADDDPCTADACGSSGHCEHTTFCCLERVGASSSFDDGLLGWFVEAGTTAPSAPEDGPQASWHAVPGDSPAGGKVAWLGRLDTASYDTGARVRVGLRSQPLTLPPLDGGHQLVVRFWLKLQTEWDAAPSYFNPGGVDRLSLSLVVPSGAGAPALEVWSSDAVSGTTQGAWVPVTVLLPAWTPEGAALRFLFDTGDPANNDHGGPALDQVEVVARCP